MKTTTTSSIYGDLHDYASGDMIRPATREELSRSINGDGNENGVFVLDGRSVYVEGETDEAHIECGR